MADLQLASHQGEGACSTPAGLPCNYFVLGGQAGDILFAKLAFAEGKPMAYMTTDFWANYDRIWLQPMYFLVTAWNPSDPEKNRLQKAGGADPVGPIFSVGPASAFYSPFWQVVYVEVPAGTVPTKYTAARQLFEDGLVMHPRSNRFASIGPASVHLPSAVDMKSPVLYPQIDTYLFGDDKAAELQKVVQSSQSLTGWLDGASVTYVDFGPENFTADANQVIQDVPLFLFQKLDPTSGELKRAVAPNVGGVAPLFSRRSADVSPTNRPHFGALWRLHTVTLPDKAAMFTIEKAKPLVDAGGDPAVINPMVMRVALDAACFDSLADFDMCVWLDSQQAIEQALPDAIARTALQPACPFVMYGGYAVPPQ